MIDKAPLTQLLGRLAIAAGVIVVRVWLDRLVPRGRSAGVSSRRGREPNGSA